MLINGCYFGIIILLFVCCLGCGGAPGKTLDENDYRQTVINAARHIPAASELESIYPDTKHFITHYNLPGTQWYNAEVYIDGGYSIAVQAEIHIDYSNNTISRVGETKYYFDEYENINIQHSGQHEGRIVERPNFNFDEALWKRFIESRGDLTILGVQTVRDSLQNWDEFVILATNNTLVVEDLPKND